MLKLGISADCILVISPKLTYFELFAGSGIGGMALDNHGATNVGYAEIDKHAIQNKLSLLKVQM